MLHPRRRRERCRGSHAMPALAPTAGMTFVPVAGRTSPFRIAAVAALATIALAALTAHLPPFAAPPAHAARLAGIQGAGVTGCQVVNLDDALDAVVVADLYKQSGGAPVSIIRPAIPAGQAANFYLPNESILQNGAFAGIFSADRQIQVICRTDWTTSGGSALYEASEPGTDVVVAPAMKGYAGQTSLVTIQNTDTAQQATANVDLVARGGGGAPIASMTAMIAPGTSTTLDLGRMPSFASVPNGTVGFLRVRSAVPVAVQSFVDIEDSQKGVYAFQGVPTGLAAERLFAPVVHAESLVDPANPGSSSPLDSRIEIVNADGASAIEVDVAYTGVAGGCAGRTFAAPAVTIGGGQSATISQDPADGPLPAGCTAAAVIDATGGQVVATVIDTERGSRRTSAYNAMRAVDGGTSVVVPTWRKEHTAGRLSTAIHVMNLGTAPTEATLTVRLSDGSTAACGPDCTATIPAGGAHLWWPPAMANLPPGTYGSAHVSASQPIAAVVVDTSVTGASDIASYVGSARPAPHGNPPGPPPGAPEPAGAPMRYMPLLLKATMSQPPTPRSTSTPSPTPAGPTQVPSPTATPSPGTPTSTAVTPPPTGTPPPPSPPTATRPTAVPTATVRHGLGPTATPTPAPAASSPQISPGLAGKVPPSVISQALAQPNRVGGWGEPMNPNKPVGPDNPLRTCLTLRNPNQPYHPIFNGLVFKAHCP